MARKQISGRAVAILLIALALSGGPLTAFYINAALEEIPAQGEFVHKPLTGWATMGWSLLLAALASLGAVALGLPAGFAIARLKGKMRLAAAALAVATLVVPPFLFADTWQNIANSLRWAFYPPLTGQTVPAFGSFTTCIIVLALALWPVVALAVAAAVSGIPGSALDSAAMILGRKKTFLYVTMPFAMPFFAGTAFLVFLLAFVNHTVPTLYLVPVFGHTVFFDYQISLSSRAAAAGTLPQVVLTGFICILLWIAFGRRSFEVSLDAKREEPWKNGKNTAAIIYSAALIGVAVFIPFAYLVFRSLSLQDIAGEFYDSRTAVAWSLVLGSVSATLVTGLGFAGGYLAEVEKRRGWNAVTALSLLLFAVPGIVPGLGLKSLAGLSRGWLNFPLAVTGVGIPFFVIALLIGRATFRVADHRQIEAARLAGLPALRFLRHVILPMIIRPLAVTWLLVFAFAMGEVTVAGLFIPPGMETLSRSLFQAMHYGRPAVISIRCLMLAALTGAPVLLAAAAWKLLGTGNGKTS